VDLLFIERNNRRQTAAEFRVAGIVGEIIIFGATKDGVCGGESERGGRLTDKFGGKQGVRKLPS
jgi:hypothetical protein